MPAASFVHAGGSVNFSRGPLRPGRTARLAQAGIRSGGGVRFGAMYFYKDDRIALTWQGMTGAELVLLEAFLIARGLGGVFTYNDTAGGALQVSFAEPRITSREIAPGRFAVSLVLRVN